jgi:hypothetical protein
MSADTFKGMVVDPDSTNDAKACSAKAPFLRLAETPKSVEKLPRNGKAAVAPETVKFRDYVFVPMETDKSRWGFWVPDGHDADYLMTTLITIYKRRSK